MFAWFRRLFRRTVDDIVGDFHRAIADLEKLRDELEEKMHMHGPCIADHVEAICQHQDEHEKAEAVISNLKQLVGGGTDEAKAEAGAQENAKVQAATAPAGPAPAPEAPVATK